MTEEVSNKELEDWANEFCKDFDRICEEEDRRMKENGLLYGTIFDNEKYDLLLNYSRASFKLKKEDLKEYVYVDKLSYCKEGCVDEYINRTYKFIRMEGELSAIFYRDYENMEDLQRFITAQEGKTIHGNTLYEQALIEIKEGKPDFECWVRYVYPQLKRSGTSKLTDFYGLNGREEAKAYIEHPILRERLIRAFQVLLDSDKSVYEVFSNLGVLKIRTCALLFASIADEPVFKQLIRKYHWQ